MAGSPAAGTVVHEPVRTRGASRLASPPGVGQRRGFVAVRLEGGLRVWKGGLIRRLGEAGCGRDDGRVGTLDLLARAGLPLSAGVVLTRRAHQMFLWTSGALWEIQTAASRAENPGGTKIEARFRDASIFPEGQLNRAICEALIGLNAESVVVLSEDFERHALRSIPEVRDAVQEAWLSSGGLESQLVAAARHEDLPTWPLLVQREIPVRDVGWFTTGAGQVLDGDPPDAEDAAFHGAGLPGENIADLTAKASAVLDEPVSIRWGLHDDRWYVLSANLPGNV